MPYTAQNKFTSLFITLLKSPRFLSLVLLFTVIFHLIFLFSPLTTDDYMQWGALAGEQTLYEKGFLIANPDASFSEKIANQFNFFNADTNNVKPLMEYGALPWWSSESIKIHMFRPLSSITHWIDYNFWPHNTVLMHLQNLVIFLLLIIVVFRFYQTLSPTPVLAALALLLYALDLSHIESLSWIASRNAILAPLFGILCVLSFIEWRKSRKIIHCCLGLTWLLLSLLSAEAGIATTGYLFAYIVCLDQGHRWRKYASLIPFAIAVLIWRALYNHLGFGSGEVIHYIDPGRDTSLFFANILDKIPLILASQNIGFDSLYRIFSIQSQGEIWIIAVAISLIFLALVIPQLKRCKYARFWFLGAIIACIPPCTISAISSRVFEFISIGFFMVIALVLHATYQQLRQSKLKFIYRWFKKIIIGFIVIFQIIIPFLGLLGANVTQAIALKNEGKIEEVDTLFYGMENIDIDNKVLYIVNAPKVFTYQMLPYRQAYFAQPLPQNIRALTPGHVPISVTRQTEDTLFITSKQGFVLRNNKDIPGDAKKYTGVSHLSRIHMGFFGRNDIPYTLNQAFDFTDSTITIKELANDGEPKSISVKIKNIDNKNAVFLWWDWESLEYKTLTLPSLGETIKINGPFEHKQAQK